MQINSVGFQNASINAYKHNISETPKTEKKPEQSLEKILEDSAVSVSISMNAKIVLFSLDSADKSRDNGLIQGALDGHKEMFDFLSGKETSGGFSLKNIGYEGKPITELLPEEATSLLGEDGFFGIEKTSDRVSNFVFNFAGDDVDLLKEGREGIVRGFEEALKLFGGQLPEISYKTQERTLELIDEKIDSLTNSEE